MQESGEMYLETILILKKRNKGKVRSVDIANEMDYSKPSVSRAMGLLREKELITMDQSGWIELTPEGRERAEKIYNRHILIRDFFIDVLNVDEQTADEDACRIEHVISKETVQKLEEYYENKLDKVK